MNRCEFESFVLDNYNACADFPWYIYPNYEVFRHANSKKWFAVVMDVPKFRLGLDGEELIDVVNLKCDSVLVGSLLCESGFFPAYHMTKGSWITVALDGTVPDDKIKMLLDMSYHLTDKINKPKIQRKKKELLG